MISGRRAASRLTRADGLLGSTAHAAWARYVDGAIGDLGLDDGRARSRGKQPSAAKQVFIEFRLVRLAASVIGQDGLRRRDWLIESLAVNMIISLDFKEEHRGRFVAGTRDLPNARANS